MPITQTVIQETDTTTADDRAYWLHYRAALLDQVAAVEQHRLKLELTTADRLLWIKERGPGDVTILKQVQHIKACRGP